MKQVIHITNPDCPDTLALTVVAESPCRLEIREKILRLEEEMRKYPQQECPVKHYFSKGLYVREIFIPAGTLVVGKLHKTQHPNVISQGKVIVASETEVRKICAPYTYISEPGIKKVLLVVEDLVWSTFHVTEERDLEKLEAELIAPNYDDPELLEKLSGLAIEAAKEVET